MKKLSWKKKFYNRDFILMLLLIVFLGIHFYCYYGLLATSPKNAGWIDVLNVFILAFTVTLITGLALILVFHFVTKDAVNIERLILRNLTKVCYFSILYLIASFIVKNLNTEQFLTSTGAVLVFWYGYKTYERDKEIQMIERYSEKYNLAKIKLINSTNEKEKDYTELLSIWYEEYFLFEKGYISSELWNEWEFWIKEDIVSFLYESHSNFDKLVQEYQKKTLPEEDWFIYCLDSSTFLDSVIVTYAFKAKDKILIKDKFGKFLINLIKDVFDEKRKLNYLYDNKDWIIGMDSLFNKINN